MSDLRDLYQEVILDHGRSPRNFHAMAGATRRLEGYNPLCGDRLTLYLKLEGDRVTDISFEGAGCAISMASASLLSETLVGKTTAEAAAVFERFHDMVTGERGQPFDEKLLGKLAVFAGVCEFPTRVKCATLAWHTLSGALKGDHDTVTTE
jgi:nitrogen fixation NifU-like protein